MQNSVLVIAGAASLYNLEEVRTSFLQRGYTVRFVEAVFMRNYLNSADPLITFSDTVADNEIVIPLTEFWISYAQSTGKCRISDTALLSSRSKRFFYDVMRSAGESYVHCYSDDEARAALAHDSSIVVKPVGLNSGLGVKVVTPHDADLLDRYIAESCSVQTKNMRLMHVSNDGYMLTECIAGDEFSADCFWCCGSLSIVRVCKKTITVINGKPCTIVYELVRPTPHIAERLTAWMNCLFAQSDISFAQFDFIVEKKTGAIIAIDFAARIGGGIQPLMEQTGTNPYADAIRGLDAQSAECRMYKDRVTLTQLHYVPVKKGHIVRDNYPLMSGHSIIYKHIGDYVTALPSSIGSRIAVVVCNMPEGSLTPSIIDSLFIDSRWIE